MIYRPLFIESLYHEKKFPEMYSVAEKVTSVAGIIFGKDNSGLVCIKLN